MLALLQTGLNLGITPGRVMLALLFLYLVSGISAMLLKRSRMQFAISTAILMAVTLYAAYMFYSNVFVIIESTFVLSQFSMFFIVLFGMGLMLVNLLSYRYAKDYPAFSLLLSFTAVGVFVVALSYSLISLILGIELMALSSAFLIIINGKQYVESAVKLFILAGIAIAVMGFALVLLFQYDPNMQLLPLQASDLINYFVLLALVLFAGSLAMEGGLFPFNLWIPDVYQGAPANISALLSGINKNVAFVAMFEIFFVFFLHDLGLFSTVFLSLSIGTMFFGNMVALVQTNVKRLFAYSSISQAGYIAMGLAAASQYGLEASMYQIAAYMFMAIGAFAVILWLENRGVKSIDDYAALSTRSPMAALTLTIIMLSLVGVPPLAGFVGKLLLFSSAISSGLLALAVIAIINSFLSVYYYTKVILSMYSRKSVDRIPMGWEVSTVLLIVLIAVIIFGLYPQPLIHAATLASSNLLNSYGG